MTGVEIIIGFGHADNADFRRKQGIHGILKILGTMSPIGREVSHLSFGMNSCVSPSRRVNSGGGFQDVLQSLLYHLLNGDNAILELPSMIARTIILNCSLISGH